MKSIIVSASLVFCAGAVLAQASAPSAAASAPKQKKKFSLKKYHRPASAAVNPELSPDKKGGN